MFARKCEMLERAIVVTGTAVALFLCSALFSKANGLGESGSWRFQTSADRANKSAISDLIERKKAGSYRSVYNTEYNIRGNYVNCTVSSSTVGNQDTINQDAPVGSPTVSVNGSVSSGTTGNSSDVNLDEGTSDSSFDSTTIAESGATNSTLTGSPLQSTQTADGAALNSSVEGSPVATDIGSTAGSGGGGQVSLNSSQSTDGSALASEVSNSSACAFSDATGTGDAS